MTTLQPDATKTRTIAGTITIDGEALAFGDGETDLRGRAARARRRSRREIPTLCYDPRLEPFGGCRMCIVELEGARNPVASCTTKANDGMVVRTHTEPVERHRKTILELVRSENPDPAEIDPLRGYASQELKDAAVALRNRRRPLRR
jgi:predicted molibdopterin-dependent oxidoreductase YjgC